MRVISKKPLKEFWSKHPDAEQPLRAWWKVATKHEWGSFADIRTVYPRADMIGRCVVFDIGGNKYRLVVTVRFDLGRLYVRHVMTHTEYDKGRWKEDCSCE